MFETINNLKMIPCGDYFWEVLKEHDGTDVYRLIMNNPNGNIVLLYGEGNFTVRNLSALYGGDGTCFIFKIDFKETPKLVKALLEGEECILMPIYHKDTIKLKKSI